ncbi:MAG: hypothetical protein GY804_06205 [Alphaproteobacteria bacterium]|nr:hypothetical protein [Alphaproteobacteria bacterium]
MACAQTVNALESDANSLLSSQKMVINIENMPNYRQVMRETVSTLKKFAKERNPDFIIIVKEGTDLFVRGKWENQYQQLKNAERGLTNIDDLLEDRSHALPPVGLPYRNYLRTVDAVLLENHYCGENKTEDFARVAIENSSIPILAIEKCETYKMAMAAIKQAAKKDIVMHPEIHSAYKIEDEKTKKKKRRLIYKNKPKRKHTDEYSTIPSEVYNDLNPENVMSLNNVKNMLLNTNTIKYKKKQEWLEAIQSTNYDMVIVSPFFNGSEALTSDDIYSLKFKKLGSKRLVVAYLNISVAKDTLPYWKDNWYLGNPSWLRSIVPNDLGEMIVDYWHPEWRSIIGRYFNNFITLGFDGVVIDGLDNHKFFEDLTPIE